MSENIGLTDAKDCDACSLWKDVPLHNFLTYMDVSAFDFSHRSTCLHTTCHIISYVCARPTCFHEVCRLRDVFMRVFAHYEMGVCTLFWLTKTYLCITLNIWHHVCHQISHRHNRNDVQPHDLTYEPLSVTSFHIRNHVWEHWFDRCEGLWCVFTVKRRPSTQLFDLHGRVCMQIFA